jgi:deoxyribonuclease-4
MFGSHLSIAGGLHHALVEARGLGMDSVQVFTKNQRQWSAKPLEDEAVALWHAHRRSTGITVPVSHDSYLINLASPDEAAWSKSIDLFRVELANCSRLDIPYLVTHPGAHLGNGEEAGLSRVARALDRLHDELPDLAVITCLEVTAGQGTSLGWRLEHLRDILGQVKHPGKLGVCLDTAHLLAAGYDLTSAAGAEATVEEVERVIGLERVRVLHMNDSKVPRGKRVDRHEHLGLGHVALPALGVFVRHPKFADVPKILETPKEMTAQGEPWDAVNLKVLRGLAAGRRVRASRAESNTRAPDKAAR